MLSVNYFNLLSISQNQNNCPFYRGGNFDQKKEIIKDKDPEFDGGISDLKNLSSYIITYCILKSISISLIEFSKSQIENHLTRFLLFYRLTELYTPLPPPHTPIHKC
jgi:hypothetical protein